MKIIKHFFAFSCICSQRVLYSLVIFFQGIKRNRQPIFDGGNIFQVERFLFPFAMYIVAWRDSYNWITSKSRGYEISVVAVSQWQQGSKCFLSECIRCLNYYNGHDTILSILLLKLGRMKNISQAKRSCFFCRKIIVPFHQFVKTKNIK